ncbi:hypothetical protein V6N12_017115 [Hibiscus sabdariffa]|uniref:Uncharacterized protein n=1 Tax=Hibiscus sabdariffa TaxID=183260 RepID=A0ABR2BBR4_9ROSI
MQSSANLGSSESNSMAQSLAPSGRPPDLGAPVVATDEMMKGRLVAGEISTRANEKSAQEAIPQRSDNEIYGPWVRVERRWHRPSATTKIDNKEKGESNSTVVSHFGVLNSLEVEGNRPVDMSVQQAHVSVRKSVRAHDGLGVGKQQELKIVKKAPGAVVQEPSCVESMPHQEASSPGKNVATILHKESRPNVDVITLTNDVVDTNLETNEGITMVVACDKVVVAPTTLEVDKHTRVWVVEEGLKRTLKESNDTSMYGPIRKENSKSANRNDSNTIGLPRKNGKHTNEENVHWVSNMTHHLNIVGSSLGPISSKPHSDNLNDQFSVQWIENTVGTDDTHQDAAEK